MLGDWPLDKSLESLLTNRLVKKLERHWEIVKGTYVGDIRVPGAYGNWVHLKCVYSVSKVNGLGTKVCNHA